MILQIDGFYTVSASSVEFESLPESTRKGVPNYPIPAMLIGKLAVDNAAKGQGLGGELLVDALLRSVKVAQEIGIFVVRVDAIDLQAKEFYLKYEFIPFQDRPLSLFLPIKTILREFVRS
jgi:predicted GNAT family N-acyltransferase